VISHWASLGLRRGRTRTTLLGSACERGARAANTDWLPSRVRRRPQPKPENETPLFAQNRGLATNLYKYKGRIAELEAAAAAASHERATAVDALSVVQRRLGQFEADLGTLEGQLGGALPNGGAAAEGEPEWGGRPALHHRGLVAPLWASSTATTVPSPPTFS
jgi:hypothetical protein